MPRELIELPYTIDYLSILDPDGEVDKSLEPDLSDEFLLHLHRGIKGQEAANVGAAAVLRDSDWLAVSFRETAAQLLRGQSMSDLLLYYGGYNEGGFVPEGINNLPVSIPVGSQALHAVGLAWAATYREKDDIAMAFFGDGATSQGDFYEALNLAGVYKASAVFICQDNQWAISLPRSKQTAATTLAQKALAAGIPGLQVDGNDVLAVYVAAKEAADRARAGEGPTLVEAITYRMSVHTTSDDPKRYRTDEEVGDWEGRDPITRFQTYLKAKDLLDDDKIEALEAEVDQEIRDAVDEAEKTMSEPVDALVMFDHLYAESSPYLLDQRQELADELEAKEA
jgi:pyruvate dehydrogenase E1 component alpha subunit